MFVDFVRQMHWGPDVEDQCTGALTLKIFWQGNRLVLLPHSLSSLRDLRALNLSRNILRDFPEDTAAALTALTDLNLDTNRCVPKP